MTIALTHATTATGTNDSSKQISKDAWNEAHTITMATGRVLGRTTAGGGAVEELTTIPPNLGGTGVANNAASTLTISGNFATTLTVTNTTSLTLPISGTLAICALTINAQTVSYTIVLADGVNSYIRMNVGSANNLTVPPNSSVAFPIGTQIPIRQVGAGQTTVVQGSGVTVSTSLTLKLRAQNSSASLIKTGTDTWDLAGDLASS